MVNFTILAGGFSTFISTYHLNTDIPSLTLTHNSTTGTNPSWIVAHPRNSSIIYATNENTDATVNGTMQSFINNNGVLTLADTVSSGGSGPTFTNVLSRTGEVTAMNFAPPGNCGFISTDANDPSKFYQESPVLKLPFSTSQPHMSLEYGDEVFIADFAQAKIWRTVADTDGPPGARKIQGQIDTEPEPRHMAILGDTLFIVHEGPSTLTAQKIPTAPNGTTTQLIGNASTIPLKELPPSFNVTGNFFAAELLVSTPTSAFPDPLIYVSNRNTGPDIDDRGDTVAIFEFSTEPCSSSTTRRDANKWTRKWHKRAQKCTATGQLKFIKQVFTGLMQIRGMALGNVADGSDKFLVAGANTQGGVAVFERTDGGRNLSLVARNLDVQNRTSFVFV